MASRCFYSSAPWVDVTSFQGLYLANLRLSISGCPTFRGYVSCWRLAAGVGRLWACFIRSRVAFGWRVVWVLAGVRVWAGLGPGAPCASRAGSVVPVAGRVRFPVTASRLRACSSVRDHASCSAPARSGRAPGLASWCPSRRGEQLRRGCADGPSPWGPVRGRLIMVVPSPYRTHGCAGAGATRLRVMVCFRRRVRQRPRAVGTTPPCWPGPARRPSGRAAGPPGPSLARRWTPGRPCAPRGRRGLSR